MLSCTLPLRWAMTYRVAIISPNPSMLLARPHMHLSLKTLFSLSQFGKGIRQLSSAHYAHINLSFDWFFSLNIIQVTWVLKEFIVSIFLVQNVHRFLVATEITGRCRQRVISKASSYCLTTYTPLKIQKFIKMPTVGNSVFFYKSFSLYFFGSWKLTHIIISCKILEKKKPRRYCQGCFWGGIGE